MTASDSQRKKQFKSIFIYLLITLFCIVFGAIYEKFGHGVFSYKMIYAFTAPLLFGSIIPFIIAMWAKRLPGSISSFLWNCGIVTLTIGLLFHGVLEIYGTTNKLLLVYYIVSIILIVSGALFYLVIENRIKKSEPDISNQESGTE